MTNKQRRDAEMAYIYDRELALDMRESRILLNQLNKADYTDYTTIRQTVKALLGGSDDSTMINPPFYCDYGKHIKVGKNLFLLVCGNFQLCGNIQKTYVFLCKTKKIKKTLYFF